VKNNGISDVVKGSSRGNVSFVRVDMLKDNFLKKFDKVLPRAISISLFLLVYFALSYPVSNPGIKIILLGPSLADIHLS